MNKFIIRLVLVLFVVGSVLVQPQSAQADCQSLYREKSTQIEDGLRKLYTWKNEGISAGTGLAAGAAAAWITGGSILVGASTGLAVGAAVVPGTYYGVQKLRSHSLKSVAAILEDAAQGGGLSFAKFYVRVAKKRPDLTAAQVLDMLNDANQVDRFCEPKMTKGYKFFTVMKLKRYVVKMIPGVEPLDESSFDSDSEDGESIEAEATALAELG